MITADFWFWFWLGVSFILVTILVNGTIRRFLLCKIFDKNGGDSDDSDDDED